MIHSFSLTVKKGARPYCRIRLDDAGGGHGVNRSTSLEGPYCPVAARSVTTALQYTSEPNGGKESRRCAEVVMPNGARAFLARSKPARSASTK